MVSSAAWQAWRPAGTELKWRAAVSSCPRFQWGRGAQNHTHYWPKEMKAPKLNLHRIRRVYVLERREWKLEKEKWMVASDRTSPIGQPLTPPSWVMFGLKHCPPTKHTHKTCDSRPVLCHQHFISMKLFIILHLSSMSKALFVPQQWGRYTWARPKHTQECAV